MQSFLELPLPYHIFLSIFLFGGLAVMYCRGWNEQVKATYILAMSALHESYLCGFSIYEMVRSEFINRFTKLNHEGFCYTFSAAVMLALKNCKKSRLVRGHVDYDEEGADKGIHSNHSWVEVKIFGVWWAIDLNYMVAGIVMRRWYYQKFRPQVKKIYSYQEFWSDPYAEQFYSRMQKRESSYLFCHLYHRYTPPGTSDNLEYRSAEEFAALGFEFFDDRQYYVFPPEYEFIFDQRIVDELMARPSRLTPKKRTLRRYRQEEKRILREITASTPAS